MSNFLVRAWRACLPWEFWLFAFTTFTEARFFHDFYAEKELEGSLFLMPIRPIFFWIKRWIVKICPKYMCCLLFLSGLQRFLWRLWKRKEYNPLLRAREETWKPWCFDELSQNVNCFECAFPGLFYKAPKFVLKLPTFLKKSPTFSRKTPTFFEKSPSFSRKSPTFLRKSPSFFPSSPTYWTTLLLLKGREKSWISEVSNSMCWSEEAFYDWHLQN